MNFKNLHHCCTIIAAFFVITLVTSFTSFGQTTVAVAPNKMNILYAGIDNPVSVATSGGADDRVTVAIEGGNGKVSKISNGVYNIQVTTVTNECILNVYVDGKLVGTSSFKVKSLPIPSATIGGFTSGSTIPSDIFIKQNGVALYIKDFPFDVTYEVLGYRFTIDNDNNDAMSFDCETSIFSSEIKQSISQHIKPGKTVVIDNILAKGPNGKELKIPSLVYYIK
jgi:hypothetical protein